jgi:hypothetical protein
MSPACAALLWVLAQADAGTEGRVVDRAVALVAGQVITQSELEVEARVALIRSGAAAAATVTLTDPMRKEALELAITQRLENIEADKLQAYPLEEGELEVAMNQFAQAFDSDRDFRSFLAANELDMQALANVLARSLRTEKILESKIKLRSQVGDAEVRRYFDEHKAELSGKGFEEWRPDIRARLERDKRTALYRTELSQIRKGADVRIIAPYARGKGG